VFEVLFEVIPHGDPGRRSTWDDLGWLTVNIRHVYTCVVMLRYPEELLFSESALLQSRPLVLI
jgi:hypothetical protein